MTEDPYENNDQPERPEQPMQNTTQLQENQEKRPQNKLFVATYNILTAIASLSVFVGAQYELSKNHTAVNAWFRYAFISLIELVILSQIIEQIGVRYYFGFFYNKYFRAAALLLCCLMLLQKPSFVDPVTIIVLIAAIFSVLSLLVGLLVQWPDVL